MHLHEYLTAAKRAYHARRRFQRDRAPNQVPGESKAESPSTPPIPAIPDEQEDPEVNPESMPRRIEPHVLTTGGGD